MKIDFKQDNKSLMYTPRRLLLDTFKRIKGEWHHLNHLPELNLNFSDSKIRRMSYHEAKKRILTHCTPGDFYTVR